MSGRGSFGEFLLWRATKPRNANHLERVFALITNRSFAHCETICRSLDAVRSDFCLRWSRRVTHSPGNPLSRSLSAFASSLFCFDSETSSDFGKSDCSRPTKRDARIDFVISDKTFSVINLLARRADHESRLFLLRSRKVLLRPRVSCSLKRH